MAAEKLICLTASSFFHLFKRFFFKSPSVEKEEQKVIMHCTLMSFDILVLCFYVFMNVNV